MLQSTEIQIKLSESRTELRAVLADPPVDDATEEVRAAHDEKITELQTRMDTHDEAFRTALKAEEVATERAANAAAASTRLGWRRPADHAGGVQRVHGHRGAVSA